MSVYRRPIVLHVTAIRMTDGVKAKTDWHDWLLALGKHQRATGDGINNDTRRSNALALESRGVLVTPHVAASGVSFIISTDLRTGGTLIQLHFEYYQAS